MPTDTLIVLAVVLAYFAVFMGALAFATFEESRLQPHKRPRR